jgi:hypothetical protein
MAELSPDTRNQVWFVRDVEARRQRRLANLVRSELQIDEEIIAILTSLFDDVSGWIPGWTRLAVVATRSQLFVIRLRRMTGRPRSVVGVYPRTSLHVEWTRNVAAMPGKYDTRWFGRLKITNSFGAKEFLVPGDWRQDHAEAVAKALDVSDQ